MYKLLPVRLDLFKDYWTQMKEAEAAGDFAKAAAIEKERNAYIDANPNSGGTKTNTYAYYGGNKGEGYSASDKTTRAKVDYAGILNKAMEQGNDDSTWLTSVLGQRRAKQEQDGGYSSSSSAAYNQNVTDYINSLNGQTKIQPAKKTAAPAASNVTLNPATGYNSDGTIGDYAKVMENLMMSGSTDVDYMEQLLNERIAKGTDPNSDFNDNFRHYIDSMRMQNIMASHGASPYATPSSYGGGGGGSYGLDVPNISSPSAPSNYGAQPTYNGQPITPETLNALAAAPTYEAPEDLVAPEYSSKWDDVKERLANAALSMNYEDWTNSSQYQALANRYGREGAMSMRDVLGQVSSRTGGLASSYAATAAQQEYNRFMAGLEQAAYEMYGNERNEAIENAQNAFNYSDVDYQRYLDDLAQYNTDRQFGYNQYLNELDQWNTDRQFGYNQYLDELEQYNLNRQFEYQQYLDELEQANWERSYAYQLASAALAQSNYEREWEYTRNQAAQSDARDRLSSYLSAGGDISGLDSGIISASGLSGAELDALRNAALSSTRRSSGSGGSGRSSGSGSSAGTDWSGLQDFVARGGDANSYLGANYKEMGFKNKTEAKDSWATYNGGGYNEANFRAAMNNISSSIAQGKAPSDTALSGLWNKLSNAQKDEMNNMLGRYGYRYE